MTASDDVIDKYEGLGTIVGHGFSTNEEKIESKKDEIKEEKRNLTN